MKKGLSILLVAAAIFGFYGSAVNVNDILACKDYWEEAGEKSTADMNKLEDGLNQLKDNEQAYLDGLDQVAEGEQALAEGEATLAKGEADYAEAPGKLAAARKAIAQGEKDLAVGKKTLDEGKAMKQQLKDGIDELQEKYPTWRHGNEVVHGRGIKNAQEQGLYGVANDPGNQVTKMGSMFTDESLDSSKIDYALGMVKASAVQGMNGESGVIAAYTAGVTQGVAKAVVDGNYQKAGQAIPGPEDEGYEAYTNAIAAAAQDPKVKNQATAMVQEKLGATVATNDNVYSMIGTLIKEGVISDAEGSPTAPLYSAYSAMTAFDTLSQLAAGKKEIQGKLLPLLDKVGSNEEAIKQLGGKSEVDKLIAGLKGTDDQFEAAMDAIMKKAPGLYAMVSKAVAQGQKDYNAGKKKLASGKAQYKQGLADYAAAPGKLEDGRQQLADGRAQLAAGKDQLAQYEDGEQQVRDGLATLVGTEADLDLESILDRLNGDSDFDNGDNHLELDEGLAAVEVGRGYQAEDGELITKEIMTRAIATGGLLAAGVLAVLAAILSFTKKNKGAGVCAILAAAAGAFGAYEATQAGSYFSSIAGSTVGQSGMIAAGILGCVALVHAIVHFTAKKEA